MVKWRTAQDCRPDSKMETVQPRCSSHKVTGGHWRFDTFVKQVGFNISTTRSQVMCFNADVIPTHPVWRPNPPRSLHSQPVSSRSFQPGSGPLHPSSLIGVLALWQAISLFLVILPWKTVILKFLSNKYFSENDLIERHEHFCTCSNNVSCMHCLPIPWYCAWIKKMMTILVTRIWQANECSLFWQGDVSIRVFSSLFTYHDLSVDKFRFVSKKFSNFVLISCYVSC